MSRIPTAWVFPGIDAAVHTRWAEPLLQDAAMQAVLDTATRALGLADPTSLIRSLGRHLGRLDRDALPRTDAALVALQVGTARVLESLGHRADWLVGYSLGEVARTLHAGCADLSLGLRATIDAARLTSATAPPGRCVLVRQATPAPSPPAELFDGDLGVSRLSPRFALLSGAHHAIDRAVDDARHHGHRVFAMLDLPVHAPLLAATSAVLATRLRDLPVRAPSRPIFSTLLHRPITDVAALREEWARGLHEPFDWCRTVAALEELGVRRFVVLDAGQHATRVTRESARHAETIGLLDLLRS